MQGPIVAMKTSTSLGLSFWPSFYYLIISKILSMPTLPPTAPTYLPPENSPIMLSYLPPPTIDPICNSGERAYASNINPV